MEYYFPEGFDLHQVQISAILMLGARIERSEAQIVDEKCHALVVLANNLIAWICTRHINYQACGGKVWFHEDRCYLWFRHHGLCRIIVCGQ